MCGKRVYTTVLKGFPLIQDSGERPGTCVGDSYQPGPGRTLPGTLALRTCMPGWNSMRAYTGILKPCIRCEVQGSEDSQYMWLLLLFLKYLKILYTPLVAFIQMSKIELCCFTCRKGVVFKDKCFCVCAVKISKRMLHFQQQSDDFTNLFVPRPATSFLEFC